MSAIASLYAISLVKFADFCKLADLVPYSQARKSDGPLVAIKVTPEMRKTAEFQKMAAKSESVRDYLERNAQSPFEYDWSGYVFGDLLFCLAHAKNINLMEVCYVEKDGVGWSWYVLSQALKQRYYEQLDPAKFTEVGLKELYHSYKNREHQLEETGFVASLKKLERELSKKDLQLMKDSLERKRKAEDRFPDAGRAFLDGLKIIHEYFKLVDDKTIAIMHIG